MPPSAPIVAPTPPHPPPLETAIVATDPTPVPAASDDVAAGPASGAGAATTLASRGPGDAGSGSGQASAADGEALIAAYVDLVRKRIEGQKRYPGLARSRHVEGTVLALVYLDAAGGVGDVEILDSPSGLLSDPTRQAILAAGPFPPPPGALRRIRVPVRYALD